MPGAFAKALLRALEESEEEERRKDEVSMSLPVEDDCIDELDEEDARDLPANFGQLLAEYDRQELEEEGEEVIMMAPQWYQSGPDETGILTHPRYSFPSPNISIVSSDGVTFQLPTSALLPDTVAKLQMLLAASDDPFATEYSLLQLEHKEEESAMILELIFDLTIPPFLPFANLIQDYTAEIIIFAIRTASKLGCHRVFTTLMRSMPYYIGQDEGLDWKILVCAAVHRNKKMLVAVLNKELDRTNNKLLTSNWPCYFCYWRRVPGHSCRQLVLYNINTWSTKQKKEMHQKAPQVMSILHEMQAGQIEAAKQDEDYDYELNAGAVRRDFIRRWKQYQSQQKKVKVKSVSNSSKSSKSGSET